MTAAKTKLRTWLWDFMQTPAFLSRYPYYVSVLSQMNPIESPSVFAMAVELHQGSFYLHINVDFFMANPQYLTGILLHEVHHIVLGHLTTPRLRHPEHPKLMEIAMEVSANEYIEEPLPTPIVWRMYESFGFRPGQSTWERYLKLVATRPPPTHSVPSCVDDHTTWNQTEPLPGAQEHTRELLRRAIEDASAQPAPLPSVPTLAGREPGRLLEALGDTSTPPVVPMDWRTALRMFVVRQRSPVHTWSRPARRFPGKVGQVPGRRWTPVAQDKPTLLIAIDTSASMSSRELQEIARQLRELSPLAKLVIAECDTEITRTYPFTGSIDEVHGRGGTDLRPIFDREFLAEHRPHGVVYFTDGDGPFPPTAPLLPTLWVLTKDAPFACPWGERALLSID